MLKITGEVLTYDDVLMRPAYSEVLPADVCLETRLSRNIALNIPLVSAAMDNVTESRLAIALAQEGGIGVIHRNLSIEAQSREVRAVKKYETGIIRDPITISPDATVEELLRIKFEHNISGVPVVTGPQLVGIVTNRDIRFESRMDLKVQDVMTPKERLVTARENASIDEITELFHKHRIEKILLVDANMHLAGMVTVKDIQKSQDFPNACKDDRSQLRVGAAVGTGEETDLRVESLVDAGADVIVVDTAHGHSKGVIDRIRWIKQTYQDVDLIGGNIATASAAKALLDAGVDAIKVGVGPGSICTTRIVAGIGMPQVTAIDEVVSEVGNENVPVIADGGIRFSGDIAKAIGAGADSVMVGSLLAGTDEAPGDIELFQGRSYKSYRGMGSIGAMAEHSGSRERYFQNGAEAVTDLVPEGIEGRVPYRGPSATVIHQLMGGLRASMGYTGCKDIDSLRHDAEFVLVSSASLVENHVHDVMITKEAPNYPGR